jgi:NAD(P)-dependent dehydrogenase (short-subunit alcohol dehydrogenase family)
MNHLGMWVSLMFGCVLQNVWGALRLSQAFLPDLRASRGRIVMISSIAGFFAIPRTGTYCEYMHWHRNSTSLACSRKHVVEGVHKQQAIAQTYSASVCGGLSPFQACPSCSCMK